MQRGVGLGCLTSAWFECQASVALGCLATTHLIQRPDPPPSPLASLPPPSLCTGADAEGHDRYCHRPHWYLDVHRGGGQGQEEAIRRLGRQACLCLISQA